MDSNFPIILCELRKEKGLSQKDAAAQLGISQALLSHYEKGIRECGQSFLLRVADFYNVSTDYLLGRSKNRKNVQIWDTDIFEEYGDFSSSSKTILKAAFSIVNRLRQTNSLENLSLDNTLAIEFYKILLLQAIAGNIPKNWVGKACVNGEICCTTTYLAGIDQACYSTLFPVSAKSEPCPDEPVPEVIKILVESAEKYILKHLAENIPPMPLEFAR